MPQTLEQALAALSAPGVSVVAGGTDWFPAQGDRLAEGDMLDVMSLPGLRGISRGHGLIRIGAATTWSDVIAADLPPAFDGLKAAGRELGSVQIQNAATIAGNLCNASPAADGVPPLLTLDAQVELVSAAGRRMLALQDFILGPRRTALRPGELMSAILVPEPAAAASSAFLKAGARRYLVISIASAAALLVFDKGRITAARVAVGACSAVPQRLTGLEQDLLGRRADAVPEIEPRHLSALAPISDVRATASYRLDMAAVMVSRVLASAGGCRG